METCNDCIHVAVCGDCFHAELCEKSEMLIGFSRDNPAYCSMFLNSADVAPVVHGRWIMHDDEFGLTCECSACHIETMGDGNYCPNCGAKMDGELNE